MKKLLLIFILLFFVTLSIKSQTILQFNKRFVECEDRWVAFRMQKDSTYPFGFIYIDSEAGLTFNSEGSFKINSNGTFEFIKSLENFNMKIRLQPNKNKVALIPESKYSDLKIKATPDWLSIYKSDTTSIEHLYRWGFLYNSWNEAEKALTYLERAKKINPQFKGLAFEFAFAYNVLQEYNKAITVADSALIAEPGDCLLLKEKAFAESQSNQITNAIKTYNSVKKHCSRELQQEVGFNIAVYYYLKGKKSDFIKWSKKVKKGLDENSPYFKALNDMKKEIDKKR